jgi:hypothetical protein
MSGAFFRFGKTCITPGALAACSSIGLAPRVLFYRHLTCDWSDMDAEDRASNARAIEDASRIFSAYQYGVHRFFVITEADRSVTTVLLASEY